MAESRSRSPKFEVANGIQCHACLYAHTCTKRPFLVFDSRPMDAAVVPSATHLAYKATTTLWKFLV